MFFNLLLANIRDRSRSTHVPPPPYTLQPAYDGVVSYWKFDNYVNDSGGGENHFLQINSSTFGAGPADNAITMAGSSWLDAPDSPSLRFTNGTNDLPFAFKKWLNPANLDSQRIIISKRGAASNINHEYQVTLETSGKIRITLYNNNSSSVHLTAESDGVLTATEWNLVVVSYDGSATFGGLKIWIDGVDQSLTNLSSGTYTKMTGAIGLFRVGRQTFGGGAMYNGSISGLTVFNKALDQTQVDLLYNSGDGVAFIPDTDSLGLHIYESELNIMATYNNYQVASDGTNLYWSNDRGATYINEYVWGEQFTTIPVHDKYIDTVHIFSDSTTLLFTARKIYRSTDKLQTITEITNILDVDGDPFPFHTPVDAAKPGTHFVRVNAPPYHDEDDILVWTNYGNVIGYELGNTPINVWYTVDKGVTIKSLYAFGVNTTYKDGTTNLGDPSNPVICRHGHNVVRNPGTYDWYSHTGDNDNEVHWSKHTYNPGNDTWTTTQLIDSAARNGRYKAVGMQIIDDYVYWACDCTSSPPDSEKGIWKSHVDDIGVTEERIFDTGLQENICLNINPVNGRMIITFGGGSEIAQLAWIVDNWGAGTVRKYRIIGSSAGAPGNRPGNTFPPDAKGYIKMNIGRINEEVLGTVFIKI